MLLPAKVAIRFARHSGPYLQSYINRGAGFLLPGELGVSPRFFKIPPRLGDSRGLISIYLNPSSNTTADDYIPSAVFIPNIQLMAAINILVHRAIKEFHYLAGRGSRAEHGVDPDLL